LSAANRNAIPGTFSPDTKWLAFSQSDPKTGQDLWITAVEETSTNLRFDNPRPLLQQAGDQAAPAISLDGKWLAYHSDESGRLEIFVRRFEPLHSYSSGKWQVTNTGGALPVWSRHGRQLFYRGPDGRVMTIDYVVQNDRFVAGQPRVWLDMPLASTGTFPSFDIYPDGKRAIGIIETEEAKSGTMFEVLLNLGDELKRHSFGR
jgi:serine/threonine-protein kinase